MNFLYLSKILDKTARECILTAYKERPRRGVVWKERKWKEQLYDFVSSTAFQVASLSFIILNCMLLASQRYSSPQWLKDFQMYANIIFTLIFTAEVCLIFVLPYPGCLSKNFSAGYLLGYYHYKTLTTVIVEKLKTCFRLQFC